MIRVRLLESNLGTAKAKKSLVEPPFGIGGAKLGQRELKKIVASGSLKRKKKNRKK